MSVQAAYRALMEGGAPSKEDVIMQGMCKEWIWEFLLKHCSNSCLLRALAAAYPLPDSSIHLKRLLLLKSLSFDLSEDNLTDRTLETMSALSSLYRSEHRASHFQVPVTDSNGNTVLYQFSLWMLHLAVRVECTIQYLRAESDDWPKFYESLEKYWSNVAGDTEEPEHSEDADDEDRDVHKQLKEELWAVMKQPELRHNLLKTRKREFVVRMMQSFLNDAWLDVGLVFLEGVAQNLKEGVYVPDGFSMGDLLGTREGVLESEKLPPVRPLEVSAVEALAEGFQKARGSVADGPMGVFERRKDADETVKPQEEANVSILNKYGKSKLVDGSTSKELEKEPDVGGRHPARKHARISLGCPTENTDDHLDIVLPRKRKIPTSLQKKKTEVTLPSVSRDVLQAEKTVQSRVTRASSLINKSHLSMGEKPRDEGVQDLEEEEQEGLSPPPWAGSPCLNETITARKRPILAPLCLDTNKNVTVCGNVSLESPVILKAQIELKDGQASLNAVVQDPLPEALKIAEEAAKISGLVEQARERTFSGNDVNQGMQPLSENVNINIAQDRGVMQGPPDRRSKKSIMDRNPTAHTVEWETSDDIADSSDDRSPSNSRHIRLPKLQTRQSFARQGGIAARNEPRRRKFRRWNLEEESVLRKEVERYGKGHWKHILQKHKAIFEGRTEVDLKDKWRNIEKREGIS
ncbi:hypothetical protein GOP47_0019985 [Adiantum capillus-veneris]|uniref:Uncharacterized protein n=1 Tax=Adiantum capillus-veneris TaxID=13818 RepID=A0A9D4Z8Z7_ADICA|nr:hypothetical protein GOP47_0019985 [Adiantum capillus-veneris]